MDPLLAELLDDRGGPVGITSRSLITQPPRRLSIAGAPWVAVANWAGPWTADERWWDPATRRRMARLQVVTTDGDAYLMVFERGRWWVEAAYD